MQPSVCVCLLPGWRHSSLGNSWSCWGWTPTAGADFSACCALAFRFKKQPKNWTSAACHCLPLSSPLIFIVHHEYLYYHVYLMLLQITETSIHSELLEGITYFSTIFITQSRYTVDTQCCWMNKWKNRLVFFLSLSPFIFWTKKNLCRHLMMSHSFHTVRDWMFMFSPDSHIEVLPPECWLFVNGASGFWSGSVAKKSTCNAGAVGSIPGLGRSPGAESGNALQYSYLGNPMDRGAWRVGYSPGVCRVRHDQAHTCMHTHKGVIKVKRGHKGRVLIWQEYCTSETHPKEGPPEATTRKPLTATPGTIFIRHQPCWPLDLGAQPPLYIHCFSHPACAAVLVTWPD